MAREHGLLDFEVRDVAGRRLGTVEAVWEDARTGLPEFLGVRTGWLLGRIHVVPFETARLDPTAKQVRLVVEEAEVRTAPTVREDAAIDAAEERAILAHFGVPVRPPAEQASGAVPAALIGGPRAEEHAHRAWRHGIDTGLGPGRGGASRPGGGPPLFP